MKKSILIFAIFFVTILNSSAQYTKLHDFNGTNGTNPAGDLISDGTYLYGMTIQGGINDMGIIFKIKPDGTGFGKLLDFSGATNGSNPYGALFFDGTFLYGTTKHGGIYGMGTIFKIKPDGTAYFKLFDFSGTTTAGTPNLSALISDGVFLYGVTLNGGINNYGTVFKIKTDGTGYSNLHDFAGAPDGLSPSGSLLFDGNFLYGMTTYGGSLGAMASWGTIFKVKPDGTGYTKIFDFPGLQGRMPFGSLIISGAYLYGMTEQSGPYSIGNIFRIKPDGTNFSELFNFLNTSNGYLPRGHLVSDGNFLFGMTTSGGINNMGSIFKIKADGTSFIKLHDFNSNNGYPNGSLVYVGTNMYGVTGNGGTNNYGTLFKYNPNCLPVTGTQSFTFCSGQSINVSNHTYTVSGTYLDTLSNYQSCDSILTTNVTVLPAKVLTQSFVVCAGQTVSVGSNTYTLSGIYIDTFSPQGCDSIVTTHLTVLPSNEFIQAKSICAGQNYTIGTSIYNSTGTYTDVFSSVLTSCDSTVITHLTVLSPSAGPTTQVLNICAGESVSVGIDNYTTSGTYIYDFNGGTCDSTVTTHLTVLPPYLLTQSPCLYLGQSINVGTHTYSTTGIYHDTLSTYQGCDSILTTNLNVTDTSVSVTYSGWYPSYLLTFFTSNTPSATYQWVDCNNGYAPIAYETNQMYQLTTNGSFAVIITNGNCIDTSSCHTITNLGISENSFANSIRIFPNPFTSQTTISFAEEQKNVSIKITDVLGKEIRSINFTGKQLIIEKNEMLPGIYFLQVKTEYGIATKKIIINN